MGSFMQTLSLASWILFCTYVPNLFLVTPTAQRVVKVKDQFSSLANNNNPIRYEITFRLLYHIGLILFPTIALNSVRIQNSSEGTVLVELVYHAFHLGAASRLWSFAKLGEKLTFAIHKPQCLVSRLAFTNTCNIQVTQDSSHCNAQSTCLLVPTLQVGLPVFKVMVRIRDEQEVLQKEFENEWEDYHRVTNNFLPGIL